jgi:hypothetical protein
VPSPAAQSQPDDGSSMLPRPLGPFSFRQSAALCAGLGKGSTSSGFPIGGIMRGCQPSPAPTRDRLGAWSGKSWHKMDISSHIDRMAETPSRQLMKKLIMKLSERNCPECMGAGFTMVDHPTRPGVKIYQECKECRGKGRTAAALSRPGLKAKGK